MRTYREIINITDSYIDCQSLPKVNNRMWTVIAKEAICIKSCTFLNNINLDQIILGESIINIGDDAFNGCSNLNYRLPKNIQYIGKRAFANINSKCDLLLPNTLKYLGVDCFMYSDFNDVVVEEGIYSLNSVFRGSRIKRLYLPHSIQFLDIENLEYCDNVYCYKDTTALQYCLSYGVNKLKIRGG